MPHLVPMAGRLGPFLLIGILTACSPTGGGIDDPDADNGNGNGSNGNGSNGSNGNGSGQPCFGLQCDQVECEDGGTTSLTGVVNIPSGNLPLPNVDVWVPNGELAPIVHGATCDPCDERLSGNPLVAASTGVDGSFELEDMPVGEEIPLVIQTGKWRRQLDVSVEPCTVNEITDTDRTRLPRNRSEGTIPRMAIATGACDALECLIRKIGVDDAEFSHGDGDGQIHLYQGGNDMDTLGEGPGTGAFSAALGGQSLSDARDVWSDVDRLMEYDVLINSCECQPSFDNKPEPARQALGPYTEAGGRVFLSHWHYFWLDNADVPFDEAVDFYSDRPQPPDDDDEQTAFINSDFEKGQELAEWMFETGASTEFGQFPLLEARSTIENVNTDVSDDWIWYQLGNIEQSQYMSFNTPVGEEDQCGRVVLSDIHVSQTDNSGDDFDFPTGCTDQLSPQEIALIYLLFDVGACIEREIPPIE